MENEMDLRIRIENLKLKILKDIEEAAKKGDTNTIVSKSCYLEKTNDLSLKLEQIANAMQNLEEQGNATIEKKITSSNIFHIAKENGNDISPKEKGEHRREQFLSELSEKGIHISQVKGTLFKNKSGKFIGIASASEVKDNRWFLGLPQNKYWSIVLICEGKNGKLSSFILPEDFLSDYLRKMSLDKEGEQIKFNIFLKGNKYQLQIRREGRVDITNFKNNFDKLKI